MSNQYPGKWVICDRCDGHGKHVNPAIDGNGISREEFDEDPDFEEAYFSGMYDIACEDCGGSGKVWEVDVSKCSYAQKRELVEARRNARWAAEDAHERRMEARMLGEY